MVVTLCLVIYDVHYSITFNPAIRKEIASLIARNDISQLSLRGVKRRSNPNALHNIYLYHGIEV